MPAAWLPMPRNAEGCSRQATRLGDGAPSTLVMPARNVVAAEILSMLTARAAFRKEAARIEDPGEQLEVARRGVGAAPVKAQRRPEGSRAAAGTD